MNSNSNNFSKQNSDLTHFLFFNTVSFEVTVNGKLVFSKLERGAFPEFNEVNNLKKNCKIISSGSGFGLQKS